MNLINPYQYRNRDSLTVDWPTKDIRTSYADYGKSLEAKGSPLADNFYNIWKWLVGKDTSAKYYLDTFWNLQSYIGGELDKTGLVYDDLRNEDIARLSALYNESQAAYWPDGTQQKLMRDYFDRTGKLLANDQASQRVNAFNGAARAWLSANARQAISNQASNNFTKPLLDIFNQEYNSLDNLNKTRIGMFDKIYNYRGGINDKYIKSLKDKELELNAKIAESTAKILAENEWINKQFIQAKALKKIK